MRNKIFPACALFLGMASAYAGTMGAAEPMPVLIPFVSGEALYAWPQIDGFYVNVVQDSTPLATFTSNKNKDGWGGRIAVGAIHPFSETWGGSAEMGWGYYGSVDMKPRVQQNPSVSVNVNTNAFKVNVDQYGFDVLAGIFYMQPKYDLFFKAGALMQNFRAKISANPQALGASPTSALGGRLPGTYTLSTMITNTLPEIKLGGHYFVNKNWLATASWMHAFGSSMDINLYSLSTSPAGLGGANANLKASTLDVVLFGVEYRFA
ncbi:MAG: hypothetical protein P1U32_01975 [Legionellaceae bacterium]|nr:hypothetical protein [Legionellaceae bacterium]